MKDYSIEIGKTYNYLTIKKLLGFKKSRQWVSCSCVCGNTTESELRTVVKGQKKSCGCKKGENLIKDITGNKYGKLTVLSLTNKKAKNNARLFWLCKCDCGNEVVIQKSNLLKNYGGTKSCGCSQHPKGKDSPFYNPNITDEERHSPRNRKLPEYENWRKEVFERDNYTCTKCNCKGGKLISHHIFNYSKYKELRTDINNGITLCKGCHDAFHKEFGNKDNNLEQLNKFIKCQVL